MVVTAAMCWRISTGGCWRACPIGICQLRLARFEKDFDVEPNVPLKEYATNVRQLFMRLQRETSVVWT